MQARLRLGLGHDIPEPAGHAAPKTKLKGSVGAVDQARLDADHQRRLASIERFGPDSRRRFQAERAADERDAAFPYLEQEGEQEVSALKVSLSATGQVPFKVLEPVQTTDCAGGNRISLGWRTASTTHVTLAILHHRPA